MVQIVNQKQAREVQSLSFCYLCGQALDNGNFLDRDHVPPKSMFLREDRNFPIILKVHRKCNADWQISDEKVKLLVDVLHGVDITRHAGKYRVGVARSKTGQLFPLLGGIPLGAMIHRIMRAFHAALYGEFMPQTVKNKILTPIPEAEFKDGEVTVKRILPQFKDLSDMLRASTLARVTDKIITNNDKLRYECTWPQFDNGSRFCVFALDIYNWESLGDQVSNEEYACIGFYFLDGHMPSKATEATRVQVSFGPGVALDPFMRAKRCI